MPGEHATASARWRDGRFVAPSDTPTWLLEAADGGPQALAGRVRTLG